MSAIVIVPTMLRFTIASAVFLVINAKFPFKKCLRLWLSPQCQGLRPHQPYLSAIYCCIYSCHQDLCPWCVCVCVKLFSLLFCFSCFGLVYSQKAWFFKFYSVPRRRYLLIMFPRWENFQLLLFYIFQCCNYERVYFFKQLISTQSFAIFFAFLNN